MRQHLLKAESVVEFQPRVVATLGPFHVAVATLKAFANTFGIGPLARTLFPGVEATLS